MSFGGFGAPAAGGFGKAPAAPGGFGAAAAPAAGGFGKGPAAPGGFGAPAPAAGFGKAPAAAGGFGAPAAGGFGAPAAGGFGAPAAGGFGAPAAGGFGKAPVAAGGFGAAAPPAAGGFGGGFGGAPVGGGGFGAPQVGAAGGPPQTGLGVGGFGTPLAGTAAPQSGFPTLHQPQYNPGVLIDPTRQSTTVRYLLEIDNAYNALHPNCKFRSFVYNLCTPGLGEQAIAKERLAAANSGGGCSEEDWVVAQRHNPDPESMYPCPQHFFQTLLQRGKKQKETIEQFHAVLDQITLKTTNLQNLSNDNEAQMKRLQLEQAMLERRWLSVLTQTESIRQLGLPLGAEGEALVELVSQRLAALKAPWRYRAASQMLQPLLDREESRRNNTATSSSRSLASEGEGGGDVKGGAGGGASSGAKGSLAAVSPTVDAHTLMDWYKFLERMQLGVERLHAVLEKDVKDVAAVRGLVDRSSLSK